MRQKIKRFFFKVNPLRIKPSNLALQEMAYFGRCVERKLRVEFSRGEVTQAKRNYCNAIRNLQDIPIS